MGRGHLLLGSGPGEDLALGLTGCDGVSSETGILLLLFELIEGAKDRDLLSLGLSRCRFGRRLEQMQSLSILPKT